MPASARNAAAFAMLGVSQLTRRAITISLGLWLLLAIEFVVTLPRSNWRRATS